MYSFMKDAKFTNVNLEGTTKATLLTIIGGSMQIHKIWKLARKLYLSSQIQNLTLFYSKFVCNLTTLYSTNLQKLWFITLSGVFCGKWCQEWFCYDFLNQTILLYKIYFVFQFYQIWFSFTSFQGRLMFYFLDFYNFEC